GYLFSRWSHRVMRRALLHLVKRVRDGRDTDRLAHLVEQSFQCCDLINVCNRDEVHYFSKTVGLGHKTVCLPFGLPEPLRGAFRAAALSPTERLARREVAFIGHWSVRKGARDWGRILRGVRRLSPSARFLFLGTGLDRGYVLRDLGLPDVSWVRIVPTYATKEL